MDRICVALLNKIHALSPTGRYVIVDGDDLFDALPSDEKSFDELKKSLSLLAGEGYIDVRYSRGQTYCLAPLKRYEPPTEQSAKEREKKNAERLRTDPVLISAFAGGALGSLLISLIFAFI